MIAYGTGAPLRQMLYSIDFAKIICDVLLSNGTITNQTIICCNDDEFEIKEIVKTLSNVMEVSYDNIIWDTNMSDGCLKKTVDNTLFKFYFPNFQFTSFYNGVKNTYEWYMLNQSRLRI